MHAKIHSQAAPSMTGAITALFQAHVSGLKRSGANDQRVGLCPFHEDNSPSFSVNVESGLWTCHAGCGEGDAATFAERVGDDPKPHYNRNGSQTSAAPTPHSIKATPLPKRAIEQGRKYHTHLFNNIKSLQSTGAIPATWTIDGIKKTGTGFEVATQRIVFVHRDTDGTVQNIKRHKGLDGEPPFSVQGYGKNRLYPLHLLADYDPDFIIFCEGEKDTVTLISQGFQGITSTTGAGSVPRNLQPISKFKAVVVLMDNDVAGRVGAIKTATAIQDQCPGTEVYISSWPEGKPDRFDITNYFQDGGTADGFEEQMLKELPLYKPEKVPIPVKSPVQKPTGREPVCVKMSDVIPKSVRWLWEPFIPIGKITLLEGDPGIGKTWLALQLAAIISNGNRFPRLDGIPSENQEPRAVLYLSAEDGLGDTLRPRLDAAGADPSKIHALTGWRQEVETGEPKSGQVSLQDIPTIETAIATHKPALVVIDPLQAYFGAGVDFYRANETRPILSALGQMAERQGVAVLAIRHLGKSRHDRAVYQGLGSIDFAAAARSILLVGQSPDDPALRVMAHVKSSLAPKGPSIAYQLIDGRFVWAGVSKLSADALLAPQTSEENKSAISEAKEFLLELLRSGPAASNDIFREAKENGLSERTLKRAKAALGIVAQRRKSVDGGGQWFWKIPEAPR